jgi:hypothetical protein
VAWASCPPAGAGRSRHSGRDARATGCPPKRLARRSG